MRQRRAQKIRNTEFQPSDPRRWEPGKYSLWRVATGWRERWYAELVRLGKLVLGEEAQ